MSDHLLVARRADVAARSERVKAILAEVARHSEVPLTVVEIARRAGVHKSFIHRHPELRASLEATRAVRTETIVGRLQAADLVTSASLNADLENEKATSRRLRGDLQACRRRLAELMGTNIAADIVGDDTADWKARAAELLEENRALSETNRRLVEELDAVRSRNRDLTKQLNRSRPP
jgi:chromosome segregation ATPase